MEMKHFIHVKMDTKFMDPYRVDSAYERQNGHCRNQSARDKNEKIYRYKIR